MFRAIIVSAMVGMITIGFVGAGYDADEANGGWLFRRDKSRRRCTPERCTPGNHGQKPPEVPFPIDEWTIPETPDPVDEIPEPIVEVPTPDVEVPDVVDDRQCEVDMDAIVAAVLLRLPDPQPAESPDISIIVGEVLKQLPPRVAYYEIVPRTPR